MKFVEVHAFKSNFQTVDEIEKWKQCIFFVIRKRSRGAAKVLVTFKN